jgi:ribonuclease III
MSDFPKWLEGVLGRSPGDVCLFERALTHSSRDAAHYERLEFLGDRVLGLTIADWLYRLFPDEPEGKLSRRLNALVSRAVCADVAREIGLGRWMRLGKQARDDGAVESDNVLGDMMEALIGAQYLDGGPDAARDLIHRLWGKCLGDQAHAPQHPKSALQEWAAANNRKPPLYELLGRSGPQHAPTFIVKVAVKGVGEARGEGPTKQEAETEAARALLEGLE